MNWFKKEEKVVKKSFLEKLFSGDEGIALVAGVGLGLVAAGWIVKKFVLPKINEEQKKHQKSHVQTDVKLILTLPEDKQKQQKVKNQKLVQKQKSETASIPNGANHQQYSSQQQQLKQHQKGPESQYNQQTEQESVKNEQLKEVVVEQQQQPKMNGRTVSFDHSRNELIPILRTVDVENENDDSITADSSETNWNHDAEEHSLPLVESEHYDEFVSTLGTHGQRTEEDESEAQVKFVARRMGERVGTLCVVGGHSALGNWNPEKGLKLFANGSAYSASTVLSKPLSASEDAFVEYKFVVIYENSSVVWESCSNRIVRLNCDSQMLLDEVDL